MATQNATTAARTTFTRAEWKALCDLRTRYQQDRDLFSDPERERLR